MSESPDFLTSPEQPEHPDRALLEADLRNDLKGAEGIVAHQRIIEHLKNCPACGQLYEKINQNIWNPNPENKKL